MELGLGEVALTLLLGGGYLLLPAIAVVSIATEPGRWSWRKTLAIAVVIVSGPIGAAVFLIAQRLSGPRRPRVRAAAPRAAPPSPLLPYVDDLREPYDLSRRRDYEPAELVGWALTSLKDEWADRALSWVEQGVAPETVRRELAELAVEPHRAPALRQRAARLLDQADLIDDRR